MCGQDQCCIFNANTLSATYEKKKKFSSSRIWWVPQLGGKKKKNLKPVVSGWSVKWGNELDEEARRVWVSDLHYDRTCNGKSTSFHIKIND